MGVLFQNLRSGGLKQGLLDLFRGLASQKTNLRCGGSGMIQLVAINHTRFVALNLRIVEVHLHCCFECLTCVAGRRPRMVEEGKGMHRA